MVHRPSPVRLQYKATILVEGMRICRPTRPPGDRRTWQPGGDLPERRLRGASVAGIQEGSSESGHSRQNRGSLVRGFVRRCEVLRRTEPVFENPSPSPASFGSALVRVLRHFCGVFAAIGRPLPAFAAGRAATGAWFDFIVVCK